MHYALFLRNKFVYIKKLALGFLVMVSLASCDNIKTEKMEVQEEKEIQNPIRPNNVPSYDAPKYHLYGGWIEDESYILIQSDGDGNYIMNKISKKGKEKMVRYFKVTEPVENKLTAVIFNEEEPNRTSFLTLELNEEKTELTIKKPNEKPVIYKQTEIDPEEFNPNFEWN